MKTQNSVFLLTNGDGSYGDELEIYGIFSSRELAEQARDTHPDSGDYLRGNITEVPLDTYQNHSFNIPVEDL